MTTVCVYDHYVFTGSADAQIKKWDLASCRPMYTYTGHMSKIHKLLITDDIIMSTSNDKTVKIWYTKVTKATRQKPCIRTLKGHTHGVYPLIFVPHDINESVEGDEMDEATKEELKDDIIHPNDIVITGSADATAKVWSLHSGECLHVSTLL